MRRAIYRLLIEIALMTVAQGGAYLALSAALRGGWLSDANEVFALKAGLLNYAISRTLSFIPVVKGWSSIVRFLVISAMGSLMFFIWVTVDLAKS